MKMNRYWVDSRMDKIRIAIWVNSFELIADWCEPFSVFIVWKFNSHWDKNTSCLCGKKRFKIYSSISEKNNEISIFTLNVLRILTRHFTHLFYLIYITINIMLEQIIPKLKVFKQIEIQSKPHLHSYFFTSSSWPKTSKFLHC